MTRGRTAKAPGDPDPGGGPRRRPGSLAPLGGAGPGRAGGRPLRVRPRDPDAPRRRRLARLTGRTTSRPGRDRPRGQRSPPPRRPSEEGLTTLVKVRRVSATIAGMVRSAPIRPDYAAAALGDVRGVSSFTRAVISVGLASLERGARPSEIAKRWGNERSIEMVLRAAVTPGSTSNAHGADADRRRAPRRAAARVGRRRAYRRAASASASAARPRSSCRRSPFQTRPLLRKESPSPLSPRRRRRVRCWSLARSPRSALLTGEVMPPNSSFAPCC